MSRVECALETRIAVYFSSGSQGCGRRDALRFLMRAPSCGLLRSPVRQASTFSDYVMRRRATKSVRRLFAVECEDDRALVVRFVRMAKQSMGDAALRHDLLEPLASICDLSARETLPCDDGWEEQLAALAPRGADLLAARPVQRTSLLISALCERVPRDAHEARLRAALQRVPGDDSSDTNAALSMLMEGALQCGAASLQHELLERFRSLALASGVELVWLVQAPLLQRLDAPEAAHADWPEAEIADEIAAEIAEGSLEGSQDTLPPLEPRGGRLGARLGELECLLIAARLASHGDTPGPKHGCVLVDEDGGVLGEGFNHALRAGGDGRGHEDSRGDEPKHPPYILHAEAHAVADAIRRRGESAAFEAFPRATAWVVELLGRVGYDDAHPCPKCEGILRGVGLRDVRHTGGVGRVVRRALGPPLPHLLAQRSVCAPLAILLRDEFGGVPCDRLSKDVMQSTGRDLRVTTVAY